MLGLGQSGKGDSKNKKRKKNTTHEKPPAANG
jgi:hypothetical protein